MPIYEIFAPLIRVDDCECDCEHNHERKRRICVVDCVSETQVEDYALTVKGFVSDSGSHGSWSELHSVHVTQDLINKRHSLIALIADKQRQVTGLAEDIARHSKELSDIA